MKLVVFSTKRCWFSPDSPSGFSTDGGFLFQMRALSELFDETVVVVPCLPASQARGDSPLVGNNLKVVALPYPPGMTGWRRKLGLPFWLLRTLPTLRREMRRADAVHAPIPGDIGTIAMTSALLTKKPLFVRHCGNWMVQAKWTESFWRWFMERFAGGRNVMLATGGAPEPPSAKNPQVHWIFSTSLSRDDMKSAARSAPPPGQVRLILVGRQTRSKGSGVVLDALPSLCAEFPQLHFDVVGDGMDMEKFKAQARQLDVEKMVTFHGSVPQSHVMELLSRADLFCFPTTSSEGFPKVIVEALASGLPVITTPVSVLPQVLSHGCGVLLNEASAENVAAAVRQVLASPQTYETMSQRAVETARLYTLEGWRDQIGAHCEAAWGRPLKDKTSAKRDVALSEL